MYVTICLLYCKFVVQCGLLDLESIQLFFIGLFFGGSRENVHCRLGGRGSQYETACSGILLTAIWR
jgi:hypothetical protein